MAPITPPTVVEMPEPESLLVSELELGVAEDDEPEPLEVDVGVAHKPVVLPHAVHQVAWSPMAILDISKLKLLHGRVVSDWPKRGYAVKPLSTAEPLEKRKRTEISSGFGYEVELTVALVTSSKVMLEV